MRREGRGVEGGGGKREDAARVLNAFVLPFSLL